MYLNTFLYGLSTSVSVLDVILGICNRLHSGMGMSAPHANIWILPQTVAMKLNSQSCMDFFVVLNCKFFYSLELKRSKPVPE